MSSGRVRVGPCCPCARVALNGIMTVWLHARVQGQPYSVTTWLYRA